MARLWAVIKREYLERVRTKWFIFSTVFTPLLFGALTLLPIWLASKSMDSENIAHIVILDASGSGLGKRVQLALGGGGIQSSDTTSTQIIVLDTARLAAAELAATQAVVKKETRGYLVLGPHILDATETRYAGRNGSSLPDIERIRSAVRQGVLATRLERAGMDAERVTSLTSVRGVKPTRHSSYSM